MLGLLLAWAGSAAAVLSVSELEERHARLVGQTVLVEGNLAECQPLSCGLLGAAKRDGSITWLSFATSPDFDRAAMPLVHHNVVIEGVVLPTSWPDERDREGISAVPCLDRCPQFRPLRIVRDLDAR